MPFKLRGDLQCYEPAATGSGRNPLSSAFLRLNIERAGVFASSTCVDSPAVLQPLHDSDVPLHDSDVPLHNSDVPVHDDE